VLREVVADTLERMADADERLRMVTVTGIEVAPDLRHAKVYLSSLTEASSEALAEHRSRLQQAIGRQVRLKRTPQLAFVADRAVAHATRVEEILRQLHQRDLHHHGAQPGDGASDEDGDDRSG
jgi:ribosome-binding factor A